MKIYIIYYWLWPTDTISGLLAFFSSFYIYFICCCCFIYVYLCVWRSTRCIHACMKNVNAGMLQHWIFMSTNEVWPTWKYCDVVFMLYKWYFNVTFIKVMLRNSEMGLESTNVFTRAFPRRIPPGTGLELDTSTDVRCVECGSFHMYESVFLSNTKQ